MRWLRWTGTGGARHGSRVGIVAAAAGASMLLAACTGGGANGHTQTAATATSAAQHAAAAITPSPAATGTPKIALPPAGSSRATATAKPAMASMQKSQPQLNAGQVLQALQRAGLPLTDGAVLTTANDPDGQLGHASGYTSRADFLDTSLARSGTSWSLSNGGAIEVFDTSKEAAKAKAALAQAAGAPTEYDYADKTIILRLSTQLPAVQVSSYELAVKRAVQLDLRRQKKSAAAAPASPTPAASPSPSAPN